MIQYDEKIILYTKTHEKPFSLQNGKRKRKLKNRRTTEQN